MRLATTNSDLLANRMTGRTCRKSPSSIIIFPPKGTLMFIISLSNISTALRAYDRAIGASSQIKTSVFLISSASLLSGRKLDVDVSNNGGVCIVS